MDLQEMQTSVTMLIWVFTTLQEDMTVFPGVVPSTLPNANLTWEKAAQFDATLDYGFSITGYQEH